MKNPGFHTQKRSPECAVHGGMLPLHLGERLNGIQEVSGSIPLISTKEQRSHPWPLFFACRGYEIEALTQNAKRFFERSGSVAKQVTK